MRSTRLLSLVLPVFFSAQLFAADATPPAPPKVDDAAIEAAQKRLGSADFDDRQKAREDLLDLSEQFYNKLATGLGSDDPEIRRGTEEVLAGLGARITSAKLMARIKPADLAAFKEFRKSNPEIIEHLGHGEARVRIQALKKLEDVKTALGATLAEALTSDSDVQVQRKATKALGEIGRPESFKRLKELTEFVEAAPADANGNDGAIRMNRQVMMLNARVGRQGGMEPDEIRTVAQLAVEALGKLKTADAATFLVSKLKAPTGGSVLDYLSALGLTKQDKIAVPAIMELIDDNTPITEVNKPVLPGGVRINQSFSMNINGKSFDPSKIFVGDLAQAQILDVTGQDPADYGMENVPQNMKMMVANMGMGALNLGDLNLKTFPDDEARKKARAKLKAWFPEWQAKNTGKVSL